MISDMFWDLATSDVSLAIMAALLLAAFVIGHVPLIGRLIPQSDPYIEAAKLAAPLLAAALFISIGYRIADERADLRNAKFELQWKDNQLKQQAQTAQDAQTLADQATQRADTLQSKVDEYAEELAKQPVAACALSADDIAGLRKLWGTQGAQRSVGPGLRKSR